MIIAGDSARIRTLEELEREIAEKAIRLCGGDRSAAARALGIGRSTLYRIMKREPKP